jgi:type VI secretion system protein ImpC
MQRQLQLWITNYVLVDPANESEASRAAHPLAAAEIQIEHPPGNPGYYSATFFLRPQYQLDPVSASLRLVSRLRSAKA